jgi:hypothetical protein
MALEYVTFFGEFHIHSLHLMYWLDQELIFLVSKTSFTDSIQFTNIPFESTLHLDRRTFQLRGIRFVGSPLLEHTFFIANDLHAILSGVLGMGKSWRWDDVLTSVGLDRTILCTKNSLSASAIESARSHLWTPDEHAVFSQVGHSSAVLCSFMVATCLSWLALGFPYPMRDPLCSPNQH